MGTTAVTERFGPGDDIPSPPELEYMAFHGQSDRVLALFKRIPVPDRFRYSSRYVLHQVVSGSAARIRSMPGTTRRRALLEEWELLDSTLHLFLSSARSEGVFPRELFHSLLLGCEVAQQTARLSDALSLCDAALGLGARDFPDLYPRFVMHKAAVQSAGGHVERAHSALRSLYARLDLVGRRNLVPELMLALGKTSLHTGQVPLFKRLLFEGLSTFYADLGQRRTIVALLTRTYRGALPLLASGEAALSDRLLFALHSLCLGARGVLGRIAYPFERGLLGVVYVLHYLRPGGGPGRSLARSEAAHPAILVTRAMGGIGDFLMMTPALHALKRRHPGMKVHLAVPRRFFPLFAGNEDVELVDIHGDLDPRRYRRWFNLTDCPAARVESRTAPRVRRGRIEIFARALGIRGPALWRMETRPRYFVSAEERAKRDAFFAAHGLQGKVVVGVQVRAEESYRDYAHVPSLVGALARNHPVLLFDSRPIAGYDIENTIKVDGVGLREAFALAGGCDVLVAPDSSFVHLGAALGVPCVGLFGPTDGRVRTRPYPRSRFLDARRDLRCIPCWRNEEIPCALTGMRTSVCMGEIEVASVERAVRELLRERRGQAEARVS